MLRRFLMVVISILLPAGSCAQSVWVTPMAPNSADAVQVLANSYFGMHSESHGWYGNLVRVSFEEGTSDFGPNPPWPPKVATIGTLPPGVYAIEVTINQGTSPPKKYTQSLTVTEAI